VNLPKKNKKGDEKISAYSVKNKINQKIWRCQNDLARTISMSSIHALHAFTLLRSKNSSSTVSKKNSMESKTSLFTEMEYKEMEYKEIEYKEME